LWIGDDAAIVHGTTGELLVTADAVVAGVHADLALSRLDNFGWKALSAAVSDIAAMGGRPLHCVVTVLVPPDTRLELLFAGLIDAAVAWACPIVGGDLSNAPEIAVSVTVNGATDAGTAVRRSGARPGDSLFVTGPVGGSAAGLRLLRAGADRNAAEVRAHLWPLARLGEGQAARQSGASAMIDVSDGLSIDLHRLADASSVGFELDEVPVAPGADLEEALGGGEDYELVIAHGDPEALRRAFEQAGLRPPIRLGQCVEDLNERTFEGQPLARLGFEHRLET
jgi:thiamine-monophosphate kinase